MFKSLSTSLALAGISTSFVFMSQISPARAIALIGNLPQTNDDGQTFFSGGPPFGNQATKALAFTLPTGNNYTLDNVILRLGSYDTGETLVVQIRNDVGTSNPGSTVLASFSNPASQGNGVFNYTFTPTNTFTFLANTKYWLWVAGGSGIITFRGSSPGITPTGVATFNNNTFSLNGGAFSNNNILNSFQINATEVATPVPEPITVPGIILGYAFLRSRKASSKSKIAEVKS